MDIVRFLTGVIRPSRRIDPSRPHAFHRRDMALGPWSAQADAICAVTGCGRPYTDPIHWTEDPRR